MKIETLKDVKDLLMSIPDKDLEEFGIGHNLEGDGEVGICADEEHYGLFDKYPQINLLNKYIEYINKHHERAIDENDDLDDVDNFIFVTDKDKNKFK